MKRRTAIVTSTVGYYIFVSVIRNIPILRILVAFDFNLAAIRKVLISQQKIKFMKINNSTGSAMRSNFKKLLFVSAIFLGGFTTVLATERTDSLDREATVITKGVKNGEMSFVLSYDNFNSDKLELVLFDKKGNRLYEQFTRDKKLTRTFKVDGDIKSVVLIVTNLNTKTSKTFEIFNHVRTIEKVIVANAY